MLILVFVVIIKVAAACDCLGCDPASSSNLGDTITLNRLACTSGYPVLSGLKVSTSNGATFSLCVQPSFDPSFTKCYVAVSAPSITCLNQGGGEVGSSDFGEMDVTVQCLSFVCHFQIAQKMSCSGADAAFVVWIYANWVYLLIGGASGIGIVG